MDPLFRNYLLILSGLLLFAGLAMAIAGRLSGERARNVWPAFFSWLVMIPVVLLVLYLGQLPTIAGLLILSVAGFLEFARVTGLSEDRWLTLTTTLLIIVTSILIAVPVTVPVAEGPTVWLEIFQAMPALSVGVLLIVPVLRDRAENQVRNVSLAVTGYIYIGWMFAHCALLSNMKDGTGYLLFFLFAIGLTDVAAFVFGSLFGRRALRPGVSPNKTIEGALGALVVAMLLPWLLRFSFPDNVGAWQLILSGLLIGVGGQLGDLAISVVKRDRQVKDMGQVIPGHGGILDRIDSLIFAAPLFYYMLRFFAGGN